MITKRSFLIGYNDYILRIANFSQRHLCWICRMRRGSVNVTPPFRYAIGRTTVLNPAFHKSSPVWSQLPGKFRLI